MGTLYVVATPIGNLEDVSLRALRLLGEATLVAAEDTRTAGVFLRHHGLRPRLLSYTDHNKKERIPRILEHLATSDAALVSDAGTPAISDPGVELVAAARDAGHQVVAVPGPSAPIAALSVAGLPCHDFRFVGFLPRAIGELRRLLAGAVGRRETLVALEAPGRLLKSLAAIKEAMPQRRLAVCRELTKLHEETFIGTAEEAIEHFPEPRGEIVLIIEGGEVAPERAPDNRVEAEEELAVMKRLGLSRAQAQPLMLRRFELTRRRFYEMWIAAD